MRFFSFHRISLFFWDEIWLTKYGLAIYSMHDCFVSVSMLVETLVDSTAQHALSKVHRKSCPLMKLFRQDMGNGVRRLGQTFCCKSTTYLCLLSYPRGFAIELLNHMSLTPTGWRWRWCWRGGPHQSTGRAEAIERSLRERTPAIVNENGPHTFVWRFGLIHK